MQKIMSYREIKRSNLNGGRRMIEKEIRQNV
jgi:hypothetical protein